MKADTCPVCGIEYTEFRSGLSFADAKDSLWVNSDNSADWRYKRRHTVLGVMRQTKLAYWNEHLRLCSVSATESDSARSDSDVVDFQY